MTDRIIDYRNLLRANGFRVIQDKPIAGGYQFLIENCGHLRIYFKKNGQVSIDVSQLNPESRKQILSILKHGKNMLLADRSFWNTIKDRALGFSGELLKLHDNQELLKLSGCVLLYDGYGIRVLHMGKSCPEVIKRELNKISVPRVDDNLSLVRFVSDFLRKNPEAEDTLLAFLSDVVDEESSELDTLLQKHLIKKKLEDPAEILPSIGSDEAGKGDLFGPLIVAAVYVGSHELAFLEEINVKDSKAMSKNSIVRVAKTISRICPHAIEITSPSELSNGSCNMNEVLSRMHFKCIKNVAKQKESLAIVYDDFGSKTLKKMIKSRFPEASVLGFRKAERNMAVAAASVLARAEFLSKIKALEVKYGISIALGAGPKAIKSAEVFLEKYGAEELGKVAKIHFSNLKRLINR